MVTLFLSFYPLFDVKFIKYGIQLVLVHAIYNDSLENIYAILAMCNIYKQLLHCFTPSS